MKKNILIILLFTSTFLNAQISDYKISKYKTPYYKRNSLDFSVYDAFANGKSFETDSLRTQNSLNSDIYFYSIYNKKKYCGEQIFKLSTPYNYDKSNLLQTLVYSLGLDFQSSNKIYLVKKLFFIQTFDYKINYYYDKSLDNRTIINSSYIVNQVYKSKMLNLDNNTGFGYGRVENVEDARQTLYILDELQKQNRLKRQPTEAEIKEISEFITLQNNKRFFDSRIQKIEDLTLLDSVLNEKGLIEKSDATYFTTLMDMWNYGSQFQRKSGFEFFISVNYGFDYWLHKNKLTFYDFNNNSFLNIDTTYNHIKDNYFFGINGNLAYYKPINNNLQLSFNFKDDAFLALSYYPNTRTYTSIEIGTFHCDYKLEYYISPKLRFSFDAGYQAENRNFDIMEKYFISQKFYVISSFSYHIF